MKNVVTAALLALALEPGEEQAHQHESDQQPIDGRDRLQAGDEGGHGSGRLGFRSRSRLSKQLGRQVLARQCRQNAVFDTWRELVGPLSHGGRCDAYLLRGGRDGSAEQFNGLSFEHSHILAR